MCSFKTSVARDEGKKKLKKDKKLLEVNSIISVRCFYILTKMWLLWKSSSRISLCVRIVLWREEGVFQDFTCRWCVGFIFPTL